MRSVRKKNMAILPAQGVNAFAILKKLSLIAKEFKTLSSIKLSLKRAFRNPWAGSGASKA